MSQLEAASRRPSVDDTALLAAARDLQPTVRSYQVDSERDRRIPPPLVEELRAAGLYRMLLPRQLGGLQVDLLTYLRAAELIAEADGSTGWNLINNGILQLSVLSFPDDGVDEVFAHGPDTIVAGTAVPGGGHARRVDGGYRVTGRWSFGSGCQESQWLVGNFELEDDDERDAVDGGRKRLYRVAFRSAECSIIHTWDMTGMRGTGSHEWSVTDVFVPDRRTVHVPGRVLVNQWQRWPGTLYALPIHALVGPHHSVIATGIARAAIDTLAELAGAKVPRGRSGLLREREQVQEAVARAEAVLGGGQAYRTAVLQAVWQTVADGQPTTVEHWARCRLAGSHAADCARAAMDLMFRAGGTTATQRTHRLARCWRDLQVVGQAAAVSPDWYPVVGRILLGFESDRRLS